MTPADFISKRGVFIAYATLFSLNSAATVIAAALLHTDFSSLTGSEKVVVLAAMTANWTGVMLAFVSKVGAGKLPGKG